MMKQNTNQNVYDKQAMVYDGLRNQSLFERPWLDQFLQLLTKEEQAYILDLGCGTGRPISQYFIEQGHQITGVDFSPNMLKIAQNSFPEQNWVVGDIRNISLKQKYDGIISWNGFFHLTQVEQCHALPVIIDHLKPMGILLMTIGHEKGDVTGKVNGQLVYHSSLSIEEYTYILEDNNMRLVNYTLQDAKIRGHSVLLAQRTR